MKKLVEQRLAVVEMALAEGFDEEELRLEHYLTVERRVLKNLLALAEERGL